jgi:hypothetical protein
VRHTKPKCASLARLVNDVWLLGKINGIDVSMFVLVRILAIVEPEEDLL